MSQPLAKYATDARQPLRNPLLISPPDSVPTVDELESTHSELAVLKRRAADRARKAADDLRIIESEMKKMRELEKGKARAIPQNRVKREPSYTPSLDQEERFSPPFHSITAGVNSSSGASSNIGSSSIPQKIPPEIRKQKKKDKDKKRKRDEESEGEHDTTRAKHSPHPPPHKEHHYKPSKLSNLSHPKASSGPDWTLPPPHSLLPQKPPAIPMSLPAGPRRPVDVKEDFSKAKAPTNQVVITTFYSSIEPWLRPIREEDVGYLNCDGDSVGPYVVPKLGPHYTEQWEEEDMQIYGGVPTSLDFSNSRNAAASSSAAFTLTNPLPKWDANSLTESDLISDKGLGPVSERLVTSLLSAADQSTWKSMRDAEDAYEARMSASGSGTNGHPPTKEKLPVADFEGRVKDTIKFYGLLEDEPDFSEIVDDPVSTALRQAQRQLREVALINKLRRARLAETARDRLAYQEYMDMRDALDKSITGAYAKLQKKDGPKVNKKKKKGDSGGGANGVNGIGAPNVPSPNPAALGLGLDEDSILVVPEHLRSLVDTRQKWVSIVGASFDESERQQPGRYRGLPQSSVFEGINDEVQRELGHSIIFYPKHTDASREQSI